MIPRNPSMNDLQRWTEPTYFLDFESRPIRDFTAATIDGASSPEEKATRLFYAVRDGYRYDPYLTYRDKESYRASHILEQPSGFCVTKAVLLTALARSAGLPARLGFADVRNHLTSPKLMQRMKTDVFFFHGYSELFLGGRWLKAAPTFNRELCDRFGVKPMDFDGTADALLHPFDTSGRRHMEYVNERGSFDDLPFETMIEVFDASYGDFFSSEDEQEADEVFSA